MISINFLLILYVLNVTDCEIKNFLSIEDTVYTIEYSFETECSVYKLLEIFYDYNHMKEFGDGSSTTIAKIDDGGNWYHVEYRYKSLFYRNRAVYRKELDFTNNRVLFELIEYEHNIGIIPRVLSSSGYYCILEGDNCNLVTYYQENILERPMQWLYLKIVEDKTKRFLRSIRDYVRNFEP